MTADELEQAVNLYLASGGSVEVVERKAPEPEPAKAPRVYPPRLVEAIRGYVGRGVFVASKELRISIRKINAIAAANSIDFGTTTKRELQARYKIEDSHLPVIRRMVRAKRSQREISEVTGLSRTTLRRVLVKHGLITVGKRER